MKRIGNVDMTQVNTETMSYIVASHFFNSKKMQYARKTHEHICKKNGQFGISRNIKKGNSYKGNWKKAKRRLRTETNSWSTCLKVKIGIVN